VATVFAIPKLLSPFDRRSLPVYSVIAAMAVVGLSLTFALGFTISPAIFPQFFGMPLMAVLAGWGLRRIGKPNFAAAMEMLGLFYIQGLAAFFCIAPLAAISAPFADASLAHADHLLGFDWIKYARLTSPFALPFLIAYKSFAWQPAIVAVALFMFGQQKRGWRAVSAAALSLAIATAIFPFAPAEGPILFYGIDVHSVGRPFAPALISLKDGYRTLDHSVFVGLISFPSYHAAAAIIFTWACWTTRLRWVILDLNFVMAASAITAGSHYLVDVLAGLAVGAVAITMTSTMERSSD
jgi:membrane-associated phospholipid phosphatase